MTNDLTFLKAVIDAWAINAKREKEANPIELGVNVSVALQAEWRGQEIMAKRMQELLEKAGVK